MVFVFKGLFMEFVIVVCKFYELECDGLGRGDGDGEGALIESSYYAWDEWS